MSTTQARDDLHDGRDAGVQHRDRDGAVEHEPVEGEFPRSWDWAVDGELYGGYREMRVVDTKVGPRPLAELKLRASGEVVTVWLTAAVLKRKFVEELKRRLRQGKEDFEPGELIRIRRGEKRQVEGGSGWYWPFQVEFEFAVKPSAKEILLADEPAADVERSDEGVEGVPFS